MILKAPTTWPTPWGCWRRVSSWWFILFIVLDELHLLSVCYLSLVSCLFSADLLISKRRLLPITTLSSRDRNMKWADNMRWPIQTLVMCGQDYISHIDSTLVNNVGRCKWCQCHLFKDNDALIWWWADLRCSQSWKDSSAQAKNCFQ